MPDPNHKSIGRISNSFLAIIFCALIIGVIGFLILLQYLHISPDDSDTSSQNSAISIYLALDSQQLAYSIQPNLPSPENPTTKEDNYINLQPIIDIWVNQTPAEIGLVIYDLDNDQVATSYHPDQIFDVASVYKMFYAYSGYRQIDSGAINGDDFFVQTYDYRAGKYTFYDCLNLIIQESYNGCADPLHDSAIQQHRVNALIQELDLQNTVEYGLYSTAHDLVKLLTKIWQDSDLSTENQRRLLSSMLKQPATEVEPGTIYDWRQGLPAGFSEAVNVYNKVGWNWTGQVWTAYADVGFLDFREQNRHYAFAVLTSGLTDPTTNSLVQLGQMLETAITQST